MFRCYYLFAGLRFRGLNGGNVELADFLKGYEKCHLGKDEMTAIAVKKIVEANDLMLFESLPDWLREELLLVAKDSMAGQDYVLVSNTGAVDKSDLAKELCGLLKDYLGC